MEDMNTIASTLANKASGAYYKRFPKDRRDGSWNPLFEGYAAIVCKAMSGLDPTEMAAMKAILDLKGQTVEPIDLEGLTPFEESHNLLRNLAVRGKAVPLLEILLIQQDLEYFVRPSLLRMIWAIENAAGRKRLYVSTVLKPKKKKGIGDVWLSGDLGYTVNRLKEWADGGADGLLMKDQLPVFKDFYDSICADPNDPVSADNLRNWGAHRDFAIFPDRVMFNLNNGPAKRVDLTYDHLVKAREITQDLCLIMLFLNFIFQWAASHYLNGVTLEQIDREFLD